MISVSKAGNHKQFLSNFFISSALFQLVLLCGLCSAHYWCPTVTPLSEAPGHSLPTAWDKVKSSVVLQRPLAGYEGDLWLSNMHLQVGAAPGDTQVFSLGMVVDISCWEQTFEKI